MTGKPAFFIACPFKNRGHPAFLPDALTPLIFVARTYLTTIVLKVEPMKAVVLAWLVRSFAIVAFPVCLAAAAFHIHWSMVQKENGHDDKETR